MFPREKGLHAPCLPTTTTHPPRPAHALTANPIDKDSFDRTLARAMNTLDHNRDDDWYSLVSGLDARFDAVRD